MGGTRLLVHIVTAIVDLSRPSAVSCRADGLPWRLHLQENVSPCGLTDKQNFVRIVCRRNPATQGGGH